MPDDNERYERQPRQSDPKELQEHKPRDLYFDNQKSAVVNYSENKFSAKFAPSKINSEDRILSVNRAEEAKNTLPQLPVKPPLEIEKSEALLSYVVESGIKYKVLDLKSEL